MKKIIVSLAMATSSLIAIGCDEKKPREIVQTVEWFKEHSKERAEVLAKCNSNPGELGGTPNCINASRAASAITWGAKGGGFDSVKPLNSNDFKKK